MNEGLKRKPDLVTTMTQTLQGFYGVLVGKPFCGCRKSTDHPYRCQWATEPERADPVQRFD